MYKNLDKIMAVLLIVAVFYASFFGLTEEITAGKDAVTEFPIVVIDPGHGGSDPGKVGVNGALEKDINLRIAKDLEAKLLAAGYTVVLTRTEDEMLCSETDINKKATDMKNRCAIVEETGADIVVSIHQNSYTSESIKGGQVFYYKHSTEGKLLAQAIQEEFKAQVDESNNRQAKSNDSYYLLLHTPCPTVIVECGFLSNREEAELLCDNTYTERICLAIMSGINYYFNRQ